MNMLIIGNGFDLAHKRPTTYMNFLEFSESVMCIREKPDGYQARFSVLEPKVKEYVLNLDTDTPMLPTGKIETKNKIVQEIWDCLDQNVWYEYFQAIVKENKIRGKDWIDFESEILEVIRFFDERIHDLNEPFFRVAQEENLKVIEFYTKLNFKNFDIAKDRSGDCKPTWSDFIEKTYQDLEKLIRCLEIYLDNCVGNISVALFSPDIKELEFDSILSFNYTVIPEEIYPLLKNTHYIHGRALSSRPAENNNMVLGVNEYWDDPKKNVCTNFNLYKKFVQRIIKDTGIGYKKALEEMRLNYKKGESCKQKYHKNCVPELQNNVYIFGHSLDVTDGDILREIILTEGVVTTIFYRNKQQQASQIANLSKILGQDELLKRTFDVSPTILFKKQADMKQFPTTSK